jgi:hypothetical protein
VQYPPNRDRIKSSKAQSKYLRALISRVVEKGDNRMQVKLVGVQHVNFTNNAGEVINGTKLFCAFRDENVEGLRTESFFVKPEIKIPECKINDAIELSFNMKGKIEMIYKA